jgi:hypothetical protein
MRLFSRPKKDVLIASFDITSSSIGGILFQHHPSKLPEVLTTIRLQTGFFPDVEFQKIERSLHKTFEMVIGHLKKTLGQKKPDLAVIVFSSPYFVSQSNIIHVRKPKPFEITADFVKESVAGETASFKKQWQIPEVIEREIMAYRLNGYPVSRPFGRQAHNFEIALYISLGIKAIREKLKECVSHSFGETPVRFQSFPFVTFSALKDVIDINKGLLLVDIGGEVTDLVLIRNDILEEAISFPLGENFLIRRISDAFHFSLEESHSLLDQYARKDLHNVTEEKIRKILEGAGQKWCEYFRKALRQSPDFASLPQNFLFIGGKAAMAFEDSAACIKEYKSQFLMSEAFKKHFVFRKGFSADKDILLMLSALFIDKLLLKIWQNV